MVLFSSGSKSVRGRLLSVARSGASERFWSVLLDSSSIAALSATILAGCGSGPLPSTGIARLRRYYGPIRHLKPPTLVLADSSLDSALRLSTATDFPCCALSMFRACCHHYPGRTSGCVSRSLPRWHRPSPLFWRVGSHIGSFEACSVYRGRDAHYWPPPAQIRTRPTKASGSYLGCLTSKRSSGQG